MPRERERIVVATDFSPAGDAAVRRAETLCPKGTPLRIDLVYVIGPLALPAGFGPADVGYEQVQAREAATALAAVAAGLRRRLGPQARVMVHVLHGSPWGEICAIATRRGASLVIVGRHGQAGIQQALMGSVADRVVRFAPCSVLVVPYPTPRRSSSRKPRKRRTQRHA